MLKSKVVSACAVAVLGLSVTACTAGAGAASSASTAAQAPGIAPASSSSTSSVPVSAGPVATTTTEATAPASTAPASSPAATANPCTKFAATHTFLYLKAATEHPDGSLTVTGNRATMVCGGADDFHYDFAAATVTGQVTPSASLRVLSSSLQDIPITHAKFPSYLKADQNVRVFIYSGPLTAISALSEQFHP